MIECCCANRLWQCSSINRFVIRFIPSMRWLFYLPENGHWFLYMITLSFHIRLSILALRWWTDFRTLNRLQLLLKYAFPLFPFLKQILLLNPPMPLHLRFVLLHWVIKDALWTFCIYWIIQVFFKVTPFLHLGWRNIYTLDPSSVIWWISLRWSALRLGVIPKLLNGGSDLEGWGDIEFSKGLLIAAIISTIVVEYFFHPRTNILGIIR